MFRRNLAAVLGCLFALAAAGGPLAPPARAADAPPANAARPRTPQTGEPYLGINVNEAKDATGKVIKGARVAKVWPGTPAEAAGLQRHDVVTRIDRQNLDTPNDLNPIILTKPVGSTVTVLVMRDGRSLALKAQIGGRPPPRPRETYKVGDVFRDCPKCPEMVVVPAGSFTIGSPPEEEGRQTNEGPRKPVTVAAPFAVSRYEITFDEWQACVADRGCGGYAPPDQGWSRGRRPVINVSFVDALRYWEWLREVTARRYWVLSESLWEYVARAGSTTPWNTGDAIISDDANILGVYGRTVPVGSYPPNAFGLYDTHGNVKEWVHNCVDVGYFDLPANGNTSNSGQCNVRPARGGSYSSAPAQARSAARNPVPIALRSPEIGFRIMRLLD